MAQAIGSPYRLRGVEAHACVALCTRGWLDDEGEAWAVWDGVRKACTWGWLGVLAGLGAAAWLGWAWPAQIFYFYNLNKFLKILGHNS